MSKKKRKRPVKPVQRRPDRGRFVAEYLVDLNATKAAERCGYSPRTAGAQGSRLLKSVDIAAAVEKAMAARAKRVEVKADEVLARWDRRARTTAADFLTFRKQTRRTTRLVTYHEAAELVEAEISDEREVARRVTMSKPETTAHNANIDVLARKALRYRIRGERDPEATLEVPGPVVEDEVADVDLTRLREAERLDLVRAVQRDRDGAIKVTMHDAAQADEAIARHLGMFVEKHEVTGKGGGPIEHVAKMTFTMPANGRDIR